MATCRPTLFLLTVKEILLVHFIITNFRVAHKMLCTSWLRNPLTTSRLSCLGRKAALTTIFLSVRQSRISQPCYTNNYFNTSKKKLLTLVIFYLFINVKVALFAAFSISAGNLSSISASLTSFFCIPCLRMQ
jgi:hypothetical protein